MSIRYIVFLLVGILMLTMGCENESTAEVHECTPENGVEASITGPDFRRCACCGGWFIEIADSTYRFQKFPDCSETEGLANDVKYPLHVTVEFRVDPNPCLGDEIFLDKLVRR
ncbi:MAG: hypothetical protein AAGC85_01325 [Bacteroidota bacterium]